jgi:hypothetical protein
VAFIALKALLMTRVVYEIMSLGKVMELEVDEDNIHKPTNHDQELTADELMGCQFCSNFVFIFWNLYHYGIAVFHQCATDARTNEHEHEHYNYITIGLVSRN